MYNCIIFDVGGTLLDTEKANIKSLQHLLKIDYNMNFSYNDLSFSLGLNGETTLEILGVPNVNKALSKWSKYLQYFIEDITLFDGIIETLDSLKNKGIFLGIITSKATDEFQCNFVPSGLTKYFDLIITADHTSRKKPSPDPLLKFVELSGVDIKKSLYVGDTKYDRQSALEAGFNFAVANWGALENITGDHILNKPQDILNLLK